MDVATLFGMIVAGGLVVSAILVGGPGSWFINPPAIMIVIGGTMGATLLNYPLSEILGVFRVAKNVLVQRAPATGNLVLMMVEFAKKARREGILSFESSSGSCVTILSLANTWLARFSPQAASASAALPRPTALACVISRLSVVGSTM